MKPITEDTLKQEHLLLYIHTPFCGTCHVARSILTQIERTHNQDIFYEMNASLYPNFMQENKIESVPCLFIIDHGEIKEKVYAFQSVANIYTYLVKYAKHLFADEFDK
ncbi:thioredoxin family protein [Virgibacillus soli]|uniref:Thioredoxin family protein n=1 Tax=Paracerasibacillus soli TaxID=480284 RepID=A0ABU5CSJ1_9BACI|nr:thioredoxin family protein [Virgibacillus soli]MDY0408807.1 thioredoxin family protein [Virgibacillus soli]